MKNAPSYIQKMHKNQSFPLRRMGLYREKEEEIPGAPPIRIMKRTKMTN